MKAASISDIKEELQNTNSTNLVNLCLRLAKFKKENKELLNYLLFEAHNENNYVENIKLEIEVEFDEMNKNNFYFVKKSLRKILRNINKHCKYIANTTSELYLLLHFCNQLKMKIIDFEKNVVIKNIYQNQIKKINKLMSTLHEDIQYDFLKSLKSL